MFGTDNIEERSADIIESLKIQLAEKEAALRLQEEENRRQMALFTDDQLNEVKI
jgi:hypothetical protein